MKKVFTVLNVGILLFVLYLIQYFIPIKWKWLLDLQEYDQMYKRWSGLALFLLIVFQWALTVSRIIKPFRKYSIKLNNWHKWIGACSPILFYVHVMNFGFWVFQSWMIVHVTCSVVITFIAVFHIGVVFYYK